MSKAIYPIRVQSKSNILVIEFTDICSGTVIVSDDVYRVGYYCEDWVRWSNTEVWHQPISTKRKLHEAIRRM